MATCYNAKWDGDSCAAGYYLHAIQRNFSTANDFEGLDRSYMLSKLQDSFTSYGSCTTLSFSSTVKSWPECPDNYLLTGIEESDRVVPWTISTDFTVTFISNAIPRLY